MAYTGFNNLVAKTGMSPALAAFISRKKYGAKATAKAAATGKSLRGAPTVKR